MKRTVLALFLLLLSATIGWSQPQPPAVIIQSRSPRGQQCDLPLSRSECARSYVDSRGREACAHAEG